MKIYQITETLDIQKTKDGKFKVVDLDSKGTLQTFDNAGDAEEFRDKKRAELAKKEKPPVKKDPVQKKEPPVQKKSTVDKKEPRIVDTPAKKDPNPKDTKKPLDKDLKAVRSDTPAMDELSKAERRRLAKTGKIRRSGKTYTRAAINYATELKQQMVDKSPKKLKSIAKGPKAALDLETSKNFKFKIFKFLGRKAAEQLVLIVNMVAIDNALDSYARIWEEEVAKGKTKEERQKRLDDILASKNRAVIKAQLDAIEEIAKIIIGSIAVALAGGFGSAKGVAAGTATQIALRALLQSVFTKLMLVIGVTTGLIGWMVAIIVGGALIWGGQALMTRLLDYVGAQDMLERWLMPYLTPSKLMEWGNTFDSMQTLVALGAGAVGVGVDAAVGVATLGNVDTNLGGKLYRSVQDDPSESMNEQEKIDSQKQAVQALYKKYPKLVKNFKQGKEEAKKIMSSVT